MRRGAHVLGQKPMSDSLDGARTAIAAARETGRRYAVIQTMRFNPLHAALRDVVASGSIGEVTTVDHRYFSGMHFPAADFRNTMPHVLLVDMAIHAFDTLRFILGTRRHSSRTGGENRRLQERA